MQDIRMDLAKLVRENLCNVIGYNRITTLFESKKTGPETRIITKFSEIPLLEGATYYQGKVRANLFGGRLFCNGIPLRIIIATDQISTHDTVRGAIPFKGQVLTAISNRMLSYLTGSIKGSQISNPGPNVVIGENCETIDMEMILRGYMAKSSTETSLYHHYVNLREREFCGHRLPDDLVANGPLPCIMATPSTKVRDEKGGHDESVAPEYLFEQRILTPEEYKHILNGTRNDFIRVASIMRDKGILIADTKIELGINSNGEIVYIDEAFTPDASRFWLAKDYKERMKTGEDPTSYSKEIARGIGKPGEPYNNDERVQIGIRYIQTYEHLMGEPFKPDLRNTRRVLIDDISKGLDELVK